MNNFFFWKDWKLGYKLPYLLGLAILIGGVAFFGTFYFLGEKLVFPWGKDGELELLKTFLYGFNFNFFEFSSTADSYLLLESFKVRELQISSLAYKLYGGLLVVGLAFYLSSISDLKRIWYIVSAGLFCLLVASMHLEELGLLVGIHPKAFMFLVLVVFLLLTFYFHSFNQYASYSVRLVAYLIVEVGFIWFAATNTGNPHPLESVLSYGIAIPVILTAIFILIDALTIPLGILYLVTDKNDGTSGNTFNHFYGLMGIYVFNLLYAYAHHFYFLDLGLYFLHPLLIFPISTVIGIWMIKKQEPLYQKVLPYLPAGAYLYVGLAIIAFANIGFAFATANEPLIRALTGTLSAIYLGFAMAFMVYVGSNFYVLLKQNMPVYKVVFNAPKVDFLIAWTVGIFLVAVLVGIKRFPQYRQVVSAYYIMLGDMEAVNNEKLLASQYYRIAGTYRPNHRADYSMASLALSENNNAAASVYLKDATRRLAIPQTYVQLADLYTKDEKPFDAIFTLKEGLEKYPNESHLMNNLALLYSKTNMPDSALVYMEKGMVANENAPLMESNLFALTAQIDPDNEMVNQYLAKGGAKDEYVAAAANRMAYMNKQQIRSVLSLNTELLKDSVLGTPELCYLYNYMLNKGGETDSTTIQISKEFENIGVNNSFLRYLRFARSYVSISEGNVEEAYNLLRWVAKDAGQYSSYYPYQLGLLMLKVGEYGQAAEHFKNAFYLGNREAALPMALAMAELEDKSKAFTALDNVARLQISGTAETANEIINILNDKSTDSQNYLSSSVSDITKYRYLHYKGDKMSDEAFGAILSSIGEADIRASLAIERSKSLLREGKWQEAEGWQPSDMSKYSLEMQQRFQLCQFHISYLKGEVDQRFYQDVTAFDYPDFAKGWKSFYQAVYYDKNKDLENAKAYYKEALKGLLFEDEVQLAYFTFCKENHLSEEVYNSIYSAYLYNPSSLKIAKAYMFYCLEIGRDNYAAEALLEISEYLTPEQYQKLELEYKAKKELEAKRALQWGEEDLVQ
ncbi:hypothetical protein V6R21_25955 [Limibacter armeniacum]|uniref:tetratricopeptide repeat protein n=1 Tax=Limibacter armeniacum TaxID=466084 RepID=UPI002FE623F5